MVMAVRLPRWAWFLVLPLLVGGLLFMHGLDAHSRVSHAPGDMATPATAIDDEHFHDESTPAGDGHCVECLAGHVAAVCVAIITTIAGVGMIRRLLAGGALVALAATVARCFRGPLGLDRPPDAAWVRLSVMRC